MTDDHRIRESDQRIMRELAARHPDRYRGLLMPWFTRDGYQRMRAAAADRANLHDDFEDFERSATAIYDRAVADGHAVEKVVLDADALIAWCADEGRPLNREARTAFAALTVIKQEVGAGHA